MLNMCCENPDCRKEFLVADELGGEAMKCPTCGGAACATVGGNLAEPVVSATQGTTVVARAAASGIVTGAVATSVSILGGAGAVVVSSLLGIVVFVLILLVIGTINAALSAIGLMLNPVLGLFVGTMVTIAGILVALHVFCSIQLEILARLHHRGLKNDYPELTCLIALETVIAAVIVAGYWLAFSSNEMPASLVISAVTIFGGFAAVMCPYFALAKYPENGRHLRVRTRLWGPRMARLEAERDVAGLIAALNYPDKDIQTWAMRVLASCGDKRAIPALSRLLQAQKLSSEETLEVALALSRLGSEQAIPALHTLLDVQSLPLRGTVKVHLVKLGDEGAMNRLLASVVNDNGAERSYTHKAVVEGGLVVPVRQALDAILASDASDEKKRKATSALEELKMALKRSVPYSWSTVWDAATLTPPTI